MAKALKYDLLFAPETIEHLDWIDRKYHRALKEAIHHQLTHLPTEETRNRKPIDQPAPLNATWELRCGRGNRFRVFYEVDEETRTVFILALGTKDRNRLFIAGEEFKA